jgi:hypothetical protein
MTPKYETLLIEYVESQFRTHGLSPEEALVILIQDHRKTGERIVQLHERLDQLNRRLELAELSKATIGPQREVLTKTEEP